MPSGGGTFAGHTSRRGVSLEPGRPPASDRFRDGVADGPWPESTPAWSVLVRRPRGGIHTLQGACSCRTRRSLATLRRRSGIPEHCRRGLEFLANADRARPHLLPAEWETLQASRAVTVGFQATACCGRESNPQPPGSFPGALPIERPRSGTALISNPCPEHAVPIARGRGRRAAGPTVSAACLKPARWQAGRRERCRWESNPLRPGCNRWPGRPAPASHSRLCNIRSTPPRFGTRANGIIWPLWIR